MAKDEMVIIGKPVRDMYGTDIGKVLGTLTDIDGTIQTVGVDCGSDGLRQIPFEQLVLQMDVAIYIPNWRLEAQKVLREKGLTLRRLKALMTIVSENDEMKPDAELIHETYKSKLRNLDEAEVKIKTQLTTRLDELDSQAKTVKMILFDTSVQFKSEEITELTFESVQKHCNNLLERLSHEKDEVSNVQRRLDDLSVECIEVIKTPKEMIQESAVSYLDTSGHTITESGNYQPSASTTVDSEPESTLPEPPVENIEPPIQESPNDSNNSECQTESESDWLSRMQA
jgi:DNA-binding transcriptional MerR regulator